MVKVREAIDKLMKQHERDRAEIVSLDVRVAAERADKDKWRAAAIAADERCTRMSPVYEAAKAWRDTWRHRAPFGEESKAVALVDAVDAALDGRWASCEEPPQADRVAACGWTGEMRQLRRDRDGVTRCPACGSTAIVEDLAPPAKEPCLSGSYPRSNDDR